MSLVNKLIQHLELNIIDKNYRITKLNNEVLSYYWIHKNLIIDILLQENICAINKNNEQSWYGFDDNNINDIIIKIISDII